MKKKNIYNCLKFKRALPNNLIFLYDFEHIKFILISDMSNLKFLLSIY